MRNCDVHRPCPENVFPSVILVLSSFGGREIGTEIPPNQGIGPMHKLIHLPDRLSPYLSTPIKSLSFADDLSHLIGRVNENKRTSLKDQIE